jgi:hypothetical protein
VAERETAQEEHDRKEKELEEARAARQERLGHVEAKPKKKRQPKSGVKVEAEE